MRRTLVVTNDFPTRRGGIESFVLALCERMPVDEVVVYTASMPGDAEFDAGLPFPVVRDRTSMLLPTPAVGRRVVRAFEEYRCDRVLFGAAAPLGLLAARLRAAGAKRIVGMTHGHEAWWARVPVTRQALRRIGNTCDVLTYVSGWCRDVIASALSPEAAARMERLAPGVDVERFYPGCGGAQVRERLGIAADAPVVVCVGRMVPRKGQDTLVRAWPRVLAEVPEARLLLVGDGPYRPRVERLAESLAVSESVVFTGGVPWAEIPGYVDAGDVFAMPSRTRRLGLEVEALGIVALEAAACGLPVVVGDSGGAPDTVVDGETGCVVDVRGPAGLADRFAHMLGDTKRSAAMGAAGRNRVMNSWTWHASSAVVSELLAA
ncbi:MAG TPA: glycosyltransferase family 4 protein [Nocardioidaceae bacterium]|nr:glycosyltransferase family 4 protein [Nocardioidaceae bacterium]